MKNSKIKEEFLYALKHDEVQKILEGKESYAVATHQMEINILPTDTTNVLLKGVYAVYSDSEEDYTFVSVLEDSLFEMLDSHEIINIYAVAMYLLSQCRLEKRGRSQFLLNKEKII